MEKNNRTTKKEKH